ncbi:hypothetical protein BC828DRAFT_391083 [Blastocladiella britannica]|nr:hypothetical protein BC828DRAFT_391083 [Blastocladiella britannica]
MLARTTTTTARAAVLRTASLRPALLATAAPQQQRRHASDEIPPVDQSKIPADRFDTGIPPQYFGSWRVTGADCPPDYPKLKWTSTQHKDNYGPYWDPVEKRNFGEALHADDEILSSLAPAIHKVPTATVFKHATLFFGTFFMLWQVADYYTTNTHINKAASRHYSFPDYEGNKELAELAAADE